MGEQLVGATRGYKPEGVGRGVLGETFYIGVAIGKLGEISSI